jgi:hypothetical protein
VLFFLFISSTVIASVEMEHKPIKKAKSGSRISLSAKVEDKENGIDVVRTYFKVQEEARYYFVPMQTVGKNYLGILPAPSLGTKFIDYLILAKNGAQDVVKSQNFTIAIDDDDEALARLQRKPPRDIHLDLEEYEQVKDTLKKERKFDDNEPNPDIRIPVETEYSDAPSQIPGFDDFIVMAQTNKAAVLGVNAATSTVVASTGGISLGTIGVGALAVAGVAAGVGAVAGGGGGGDGSDGVESTGGGGTVVQCNETTRSGGDNPETHVVELGKTSGTFDFLWNMSVSIKDRMTITYEDRTLFNTGCVIETGSQQISYGGNSTQITVRVFPNCENPTATGTSWIFRVTCP